MHCSSLRDTRDDLIADVEVDGVYRVVIDASAELPERLSLIRAEDPDEGSFLGGGGEQGAAEVELEAFDGRVVRDDGGLGIVRGVGDDQSPAFFGFALAFRGPGAVDQGEEGGDVDHVRLEEPEGVLAGRELSLEGKLIKQSVNEDPILKNDEEIFVLNLDVQNLRFENDLCSNGPFMFLPDDDLLFGEVGEESSAAHGQDIGRFEDIDRADSPRELSLLPQGQRVEVEDLEALRSRHQHQRSLRVYRYTIHCL